MLNRALAGSPIGIAPKPSRTIHDYVDCISQLASYARSLQNSAATRSAHVKTLIAEAKADSASNALGVDYDTRLAGCLERIEELEDELEKRTRERGEVESRLDDAQSELEQLRERCDDAETAVNDNARPIEVLSDVLCRPTRTIESACQDPVTLRRLLLDSDIWNSY
jgi:chromosome segregation ATPase